jgi:hypothetical protein
MLRLLIRQEHVLFRLRFGGVGVLQWVEIKAVERIKQH